MYAWNSSKPLIILWAFISCVHSHSFSRTFKAKRNMTEKKVGEGRFVKAIKKLTRIDPIPDIPPVSTPSSRRNIGELNEQSFAFDICQSTNLCLNNGTCVARLNEYFCNCPNTHYGKTCEFKADSRRCEDNMCMNNSTCYSTKDGRVVPNLRLREAATRNVTIFVQYECWCRDGFQGAFCEFSEATRHCMEDRCNHHGIVAPVSPQTSTANGTTAMSTVAASTSTTVECICHCEEFYSGAECDVISPCRDLDCTNNGTCVVDAANGTASCRCPTHVQLIDVRLRGDQCEIADVPDEQATDDCVPCRGNFLRYISCLLKRLDEQLANEDLEEWLGDCQRNDQCRKDIEHFDCFNNGTCQVAVSQLPLPQSHPLNDRLFLIPKCLCADGFEGNLCERRIRNECDVPPPQAAESGDSELLAATRCLNNATCRFNSADGTTDCVCKPGFRGPRCGQRDPCVPNPCGEALCVEFPLSDTFSDEDLKHTCICKTSQKVDETTHTCQDDAYKMCLNYDGSPRCENGGNCYPCQLDSPDMRVLALCDEAERNRQFRCVCTPGFHPPFCRENATICDAHHCQNGAQCETIPGRPLDYRCICRPGFNGTFCHISLGICLEKGDANCIQGSCMPDDGFRRGFRCDCEDGFEGLNCEFPTSWSVRSLYQDYYALTLPFLMFIVCSPLVIILVSKRAPLAEKQALSQMKPNA